ncbi:MAG TPA: hypothetical protein VLB02_01935 [Candidatus Paceibacterota bacterium]|nr:hypothetical protein [Candidatus Paceibacterota bacterium]
MTAREQELQVVKQQEDSVRKKNAEFSRMLAAQNDSILFLKERSVGYADMQKKLVVAETKEDSLVREVTSVNVQLVKAAGEQKKLQQQNSFLGSILDSTKKADSTKFVALQQQLAERNKETGNTTTASVNGLGKGILVVIGISIVITGILIFSWAKFGQTRKKQLLIGLAGSAIIIVLTLTFSWFFFSKEPEVVHAEEQEKQELKDSLAKEYQVKLVDTLKKVAKLPVPVVHASDTALATSLERERVLKESLAAKADSLFAVNKEKNAIIDSLKLVTKRDNIADTTQQRSRSSVVIKGPGRYSIPRNQVVVRSKKRNPGKYSLP